MWLRQGSQWGSEDTDPNIYKENEMSIEGSEKLWHIPRNPEVCVQVKNCACAQKRCVRTLISHHRLTTRLGTSRKWSWQNCELHVGTGRQVSVHTGPLGKRLELTIPKPLRKSESSHYLRRELMKHTLPWLHTIWETLSKQMAVIITMNCVL